MRLAFGVLGWPPQLFWQATPRELAAALEGCFGRIAAPLDRSGLERLMAAFPDG
ncbi:phage tail assembly chaperone [Phreatobacter sp.]|uniref:phage tail assembly chaperone n=1 Tax=Phreatobacter sp. TaxID=1966341 RepID=UPI0022BEBBB2|nr:phage tail assembly chaperone [Phreatobacter sp.]MCZ8314355.1 phage tail assembly chaperone [Phreatobacter sp.]